MARAVATIQATIKAQLAANPDLTYTDTGNVVRNITYNTSRRAMWLAWSFVVATCQAILEQLMDVYETNIETQVARAAAASQLWIQAKMFEFQFDSTNPQIVQLINTIPQYQVIDATKRIITACAVSVDLANNVNIKVAKGNTFVQLDSLTELPAAQAYINIIGDAGITYNVISLPPDKLYIQAYIYFQGQYSAVIKSSVITAIINYLQDLSKTNFDGSLLMSDLENVIRKVAGVNDVVMVKVVGRPDATAFGGGFVLIQGKTVYLRKYDSAAGYIVQETTGGQTFADSLNFIAQ